MIAADRSGGNRRVLWLLALIAAALFVGSIVYIASQAPS
jgi:uncharacterized membrane protein